jgi:hypothetical protein
VLSIAYMGLAREQQTMAVHEFTFACLLSAAAAAV